MTKFIIACCMIVALAGCEAGPTYLYEFPQTDPMTEGRTYRLTSGQGEILYIGAVREVGDTGIFFMDGADLSEVPPGGSQ